MILQRLSLLMALMYLQPKSGHSTLITLPRDTEVLISKSTYFNCSTSILSEKIHWYHNRVGENQTNYVYYKGQFNQIYAERYSIEINTNTGEYNLIIRSVKPGDAGRYVCQDDGGLGNLGSAELIVLESTPTCLSSMKPDGFVGPNSCDLPLETLQLSCSVSYNGNIHPILQWKIDGNDAPILEGTTTDYSEKRVTVNLTMSSEVELDGKVFTCSTTRSQDKQLSCSTDPAKINYAVGQPAILNRTKGESITCLANATVPCTYRWFYANDTLCPASCSHNLTTHRLGEHSCEASCPINGIGCTFVALRILVFEEEPSAASEESTKMLLIAIGLLVPTVVVLLITTCILLFIIRKGSMKTKWERPSVETATDTVTNLLKTDISAKTANTELKTSVLLKTISQSRDQMMQPTITEDKPTINNEVLENEMQHLLTKGDEQTSSKGTEIHVITKDSNDWGRAIAGVAHLEDLIYIVIDNSSDVVTYDAGALDSKNRYPLKELVNPWDLASCKINRCLYVMDRGLTTGTSNHIVRICIGKHGGLDVLENWSTGNVYGNLSATSDGNVIVTFCDSRRLFIYGPDGSTINNLLLSEDLIHPTHALQLRKGQFLVCHGTNKDIIRRVCIYNENGEIMKSSDKMDAPSYLAADETGLTYFVADQGSKRVCVLNSDLDQKEQVVSEIKELDLRGPQRICWNVKTRMLLVADNDVSDISRRDGKLLILT